MVHYNGVPVRESPMNRHRSSIRAILPIAVLAFTSQGCAIIGSPAYAQAQNRRDACSWMDSTFTQIDLYRSVPVRVLDRAVLRVVSEAPRRLRKLDERCSGVGLKELGIGLTPLQFAAWKLSDRHLPIFATLLRHGADVNARVVTGPTAHEKSRARTIERQTKNMTRNEADAFARLAKHLMTGHTAASPRDDPRYVGAAALHFAAEKGGTSGVLNLLIEAGADLVAQTDAGATALHFAAGRGNARNVRVLLEAGADASITDPRGWTPLHWAASEGKDAQVIVELIDRGGADPKAKTDSGETAYDLVVSNDALKDGDAAYVLEPR